HQLHDFNERLRNKELHLETIKYNLPRYKEVGEKTTAEPKTRQTLQNLTLLLSRFHLVAKQLRHRHSEGETLDIENEYDVQDLLHSLLHIYFDDIRPEETTPS